MYKALKFTGFFYTEKTMIMSMYWTDTKDGNTQNTTCTPTKIKSYVFCLATSSILHRNNRSLGIFYAKMERQRNKITFEYSSLSYEFLFFPGRIQDKIQPSNKETFFFFSWIIPYSEILHPVKIWLTQVCIVNALLALLQNPTCQSRYIQFCRVCSIFP